MKSHNFNTVHDGVPNLMVVTIEEPPYVMLKCRNCTGNKRYEGFAIDLLNSISKVSFYNNRKFSYIINALFDDYYQVLREKLRYSNKDNDLSLFL